MRYSPNPRSRFAGSVRLHSPLCESWKAYQYYPGHEALFYSVLYMHTARCLVPRATLTLVSSLSSNKVMDEIDHRQLRPHRLKFSLD
jgi:hypothetical protein